MLPVVTTAEVKEGEAKIDRRKTRQVAWEEARLALAHTPGSVTPIFGATLGSVEEAGERMAVAALEVGLGSETKVHGLGDGAAWIIGQIEEQFGANGSYLIDIGHQCEYLAAAGKPIVGDGAKVWMEQRKEELKDNRWNDVLEILKPHLEPEEIPSEQAPVRASYRYISNHSGMLDYKGAMAAGLPTGSGEIESAHRYVFQKRLKISGGWWKRENLGKMIALRVLRANNGWAGYWEHGNQQAA